MGVRLDDGRCGGGDVGHLVDFVCSLGRLVPSALRSSSGKCVLRGLLLAKAVFEILLSGSC